MKSLIDWLDIRVGQRELTILVMSSTVVRTLCWLPIQIFVLADVFVPDPDMETPPPSGVEDAAYLRKWELFCVCSALVGCCTSLPILRAVSTDCRDSIRLVLGRRRKTGANRRHLRRLQMEPGGPPCPSTLSAAMLSRQRSYQPESDIDVMRPKHLSLPPAGRRLSAHDVNETILSIISDSSNHINYA